MIKYRNTIKENLLGTGVAFHPHVNPVHFLAVDLLPEVKPSERKVKPL